MYSRQSKKFFVFALTISFLLALFFFGSLTPVAYAGCATGWHCFESYSTVQDFRSGCQGGTIDAYGNRTNCTQQYNNGDWAHPRTYYCDADCSTGSIAELCCNNADCSEDVVGCGHITNCYVQDTNPPTPTNPPGATNTPVPIVR